MQYLEESKRNLVSDIQDIIEDSVVVKSNSRERGVFEARGYVMSGWHSTSAIPGVGEIILVKPSEKTIDAFYRKHIKGIASLTCKKVGDAYQWVIAGKNDRAGYVVGTTLVNSTPASMKQIQLPK